MNNKLTLHHMVSPLNYIQKIEIQDFMIKASQGDLKSAMHGSQKAIKYAVNLKVDIINISGGGVEPNDQEKSAIESALNSGIRVVAAAGNERSSLDHATYYPAMYDPRIIVVGNGKTEKDRAPSSNWGSVVDYWVDGVNKRGEYGNAMTGTSQSTAIETGKLVKDYVQSR